jgi:hypothetical protein
MQHIFLAVAPHTIFLFHFVTPKSPFCHQPILFVTSALSFRPPMVFHFILTDYHFVMLQTPLNPFVVRRFIRLQHSQNSFFAHRDIYFSRIFLSLTDFTDLHRLFLITYDGTDCFITHIF